MVRVALASCLAVAVPTISIAAPEPMEIAWQDSGVGKIGDIAQIEIGETLRFTDAEGTKTFLAMTENIPDGSEVATIVGSIPGTEAGWFAIFSWNAIGYVKDDEKDKINADAILDDMKAGTERANEERRKRGWAQVHVVGWKSPPAYDEHSHTLGWAVRGKTEGADGESVNYFTRLLGRHGVMSVELIAGADEYDAALVEFRKVLHQYSFQSGKTYAEYRRGDTVAKVGLTALIVGGAGAVAAKTGLLAKYWKLLVAGIVAIGAALRSFFSRLFGRRRDEVVEPPPAPPMEPPPASP